MNTKRFSRTLASLFLLILTVPVFSFPGDMVPYKDKVAAIITDAMVGETAVALSFSAAGQGTHVGNFTTAGNLIVDLQDFQFTGTNILTAANGDRIFIEILGRLTQIGMTDEYIITVQTTFVGGTGRFVNVSGGFSGEGRLHLTGNFVGSTFTGIGAGTISKPRK